MNFDLEALYKKYIVYSQDFQDDFARRSGKPICAGASSCRISFVDFCDVWLRWGRHGIQAHWQQQLERGYIGKADRGAERRAPDQPHFLRRFVGEPVDGIA